MYAIKKQTNIEIFHYTERALCYAIRNEKYHLNGTKERKWL